MSEIVSASETPSIVSASVSSVPSISTLPDISNDAAVTEPVVVRFSLPKLIAPELSVIEPAANARVPPLRVVAFTVVVASVVIVADVIVPPTTPEIVGAVKVTTVAVALMPLDNDVPSPILV